MAARAEGRRHPRHPRRASLGLSIHVPMVAATAAVAFFQKSLGHQLQGKNRSRDSGRSWGRDRSCGRHRNNGREAKVDAVVEIQAVVEVGAIVKGGTVEVADHGAKQNNICSILVQSESMCKI